MKGKLEHKGQIFNVNFDEPFDISMCLNASENATRAWYADVLKIEPVTMGNWIGNVKKGASVNFNNIFFNPHAHGTHTECVGHISTNEESVNDALKTFHFMAQVVTVVPEKIENDFVITIASLQKIFENKNGVDALIIRTFPNNDSKLTTNYSDTNPTYIDAAAMQYIVGQNIKHLLLDLPSVDREKDDGALAAHKIFWEFPANTQHHKTITEMIYVGNKIEDGMYLLNLQMASINNDASPSKPVLYKLIK